VLVVTACAHPAHTPVRCALSLQRRSSEYLELLASGNLQFAGTAPFTIELWVMPQATTKVADESKSTAGGLGISRRRVGGPNPSLAAEHSRASPPALRASRAGGEEGK
jgi:hypothetical protein